MSKTSKNAEYTIIISTKKKLKNYHIKELKEKIEYDLYPDYDIKITIKDFFLSKI